MTHPASTSPAVYRLLPSLQDLRTLVPHRPSGVKVARWQRSGSPADRPEQLDTRWTGEDEGPPAEFACSAPGVPILSRRAADALGAGLHAAGSLLPVLIDGSEAPDYVFLLVEEVVDCVDTRRSSKPKSGTADIKKTVFLPDALPLRLPAFRVPQSPWNVHWTAWAADRLSALLGDGLERRLIWSADPAATPHPNPWGLM